MEVWKKPLDDALLKTQAVSRLIIALQQFGVSLQVEEESPDLSHTDFLDIAVKKCANLSLRLNELIADFTDDETFRDIAYDLKTSLNSYLANELQLVDAILAYNQLAARLLRALVVHQNYDTKDGHTTVVQ
jgi:hypothetical protein